MNSPLVALVTGGSGGIGRAIALRFADAGMHVAVAARVDGNYPATPEDAVEEIRSGNGTAAAFDCDLSRSEDRLALVQRVENILGPVDILVNNAAVSTMQDVVTFPARRFDLMFDVQVRAPFELSQAVLPGMRSRGRGAIINITSRAALHPRPPETGTGVAASRDTVYGMCKAAVERFTTGLASEVYDDGIDVNALAPSHIVPTFGARAFFDLETRQTEPVEIIAEAALILAMPQTPRITGQILFSQDVTRFPGGTLS